MKIVIDIPDIDYEHIKEYYEKNDDVEATYSYIYYDTILPKGHGDLIDRTEVIKSLFDYHNGKKTIGQCIDDVPTIIEAESER